MFFVSPCLPRLIFVSLHATCVELAVSRLEGILALVLAQRANISSLFKPFYSTNHLTEAHKEDPVDTARIVTIISKLSNRCSTVANDTTWPGESCFRFMKSTSSWGSPFLSETGCDNN